jgi:DNA primase large subunit
MAASSFSDLPLPPFSSSVTTVEEETTTAIVAIPTSIPIIDVETEWTQSEERKKLFRKGFIYLPDNVMSRMIQADIMDKFVDIIKETVEEEEAFRQQLKSMLMLSRKRARSFEEAEEVVKEGKKTTPNRIKKYIKKQKIIHSDADIF